MLAGGSYVLIGLVPVSLGLLGATLVPGPDDPEQILPTKASPAPSPVIRPHPRIGPLPRRPRDRRPTSAEAGLGKPTRPLRDESEKSSESV